METDTHIGVSEAIAVLTWRSLLSDFRPMLEGITIPDFIDPVAFRAAEWKELGIVQPTCFKRYVQLRDFFKRFTFRTDALTPQQRADLTNRKYLDLQRDLAAPRGEYRIATKEVLREARKIVKDILGPFSDNVYDLVRFGRRASIGCPLRRAYIDVKMTDPEAYTSSKATSIWFERCYLPTDRILGRIHRIHHGGIRPVLVDSLKLVNVPKTWKIDRGITPLPLLDLFRSYGIGRYIARRLKAHGLNLATLQRRHRTVIQKFSIDKSHVTADLSSASDCITSDILMRLLPREWWNQLRPCLMRQIVVDDTLHHTMSVLPMGNGFTFPVETLVFYSLLQAIRNLLGRRSGLVSVYGDDLIYPAWMHKYVVAVFTDVGFRFNTDKTFVNYPFRESCGSDFYCGLDVRPAMPGQLERDSKGHLEAWLYKLYNTLIRRWDRDDISNTLLFLEGIIKSVAGRILTVPPHFPDYAGVHVTSVDEGRRMGGNITCIVDKNADGCLTGNYRYTFTLLSMRAERLIIAALEPYYWCAVSGNPDVMENEDYGNKRAISYAHAIRIAPEPQVKWTKVPHPSHRPRPKQQVKRVVLPTVASKTDSRIYSQNASLTFWLMGMPE